MKLPAFCVQYMQVRVFRMYCKGDDVRAYIEVGGKYIIAFYLMTDGEGGP